MPGAAFASGLRSDVSGETCGQARSKAGAVEGAGSPAIDLDDGIDRRMGFELSWLSARVEKEVFK
jgi:hypothetical protein